MPKVGLNPYALGMRLFYHIWAMEDRGCYCLDYVSLRDEVKRKKFNTSKNSGRDLIFSIRENLCDFTFINRYIDQEFMNSHKLFVSGTRMNRERMSVEYYIKSRRAEDYKEMLVNTLYHPPKIQVDHEKSRKGELYMVHTFEGKPLKADFIENTMIGIEFLWGSVVRLETWEQVKSSAQHQVPGNFWDPVVPKGEEGHKNGEYVWKRFVYVMENRKLHKREI